MATVSMDYASAATITITLASLGDTSWRQSNNVSNATNKYVDAHIGGLITTGTSPTDNEAIYVYAYASWDAGTNYTAGASGTDSAYTADGEEGLLALLQVIEIDATSDQQYAWGPVSVADAFGAMPSHWGVIVRNETGTNLNATGGNHEIKYTGIKLVSQ